MDFIHDIENLLPNEISDIFNIRAKLFTSDNHYSTKKKNNTPFL